MTAASGGGSRREGLIIYNDTSNRLNFWDGSKWIEAGGVTTVSGSEVNQSVTAAKDTTHILTAPAAGFYRVSVYAVTTGQSGNPSEAVQITWYDTGAKRTATLNLLKNDTVNAVYSTYLSGGHLNYAITGTFSGTTTVRIRVEPLL
jgi:hypothetical protein